MKEYGPVNGAKILEWIAEERINDQTPVQIHGSSNWQPLKTLIETLKTGRIPTPPPVLPGKKPLPGQKWPKR